MARQVLVVSQSAVMRRIIRAKIEANLNDAMVLEARDQKETFQILEQRGCHVVLYLVEDTVEKALDVFEQGRELSGDRLTSFLLLIDAEKKSAVQKALAAGVSGCLSIPCSAVSLAGAIDRACPSFSLRRSPRFSAPQTIARIQQRRLCLQASVINFSEGGMLCQIELFDDYLWSEPVMATLHFNIEEEEIIVPNLYSIPVHLNVLESNPDYTPKCLRVAYSFRHPSADTMQALSRVFDLLSPLEFPLGDERENWQIAE